jgi:hypothetical protein
MVATALRLRQGARDLPPMINQSLSWTLKRRITLVAGHPGRTAASGLALDGFKTSTGRLRKAVLRPF